jgi:cytochrome oxidase Cu insertion factor (SCO1/SenC/PrrC family)
MVQIIMALAIVAALVYFVLFRGAPEDDAPSAQPYATEVEKAEQVEQTLQQTQQLQQRQIDEQTQSLPRPSVEELPE